MRTRTKLLLGFLLLICLIAAAFFLFRPEEGRAEFGPAVALCPGPDQFGYTCTSAGGFAFIDATQDSGLYVDDGVITLPLPFPFVFYGTTYSEVQAGSNGNLQFANGNPRFDNECLTDGPLVRMGDMIAPFWDDLDLTAAGTLDTEVVGSTPNRVFVVEWDDVPRYGMGGDDRVTFAVHLFETSNDIVFLYEDVTTLEESNGRSATIGLQSEAAGIALQFSCNQASQTDGGGLYLPFPAEPNPDIGRETTLYRPEPAAGPVAKGDVADLMTTLDRRGPAALGQLQRRWLSQSPQRMSDWVWADLDRNGRSDLILLWRGARQKPDLAQLVVLTPGEDGGMDLWLDWRENGRFQPIPQLTLAETADLTGDNNPDILLHDPDGGYQFVLTTAPGELSLLPLPEQCRGSLRILTTPPNPLPQIVRDGCPTSGRFSVTWDGQSFTPQ